ncbi:Protein CBG19117 [Caenorhabditis briggsae]|uniref:Protein CBG19117 n=1 Tax=Caenorhabditis briggsae TaxID=6238 RepID=A8XUU7_CAEBR|nr:Protein CBG19117 [Caenorhabditis briggsae]CAP36418.2 Protein CBG19117 [Caenorhabditis briggsae]
MANFTNEKELEDIVHQMGQNIRSTAQLAQLKNGKNLLQIKHDINLFFSEINRYLNEESCVSEEDENPLNESLFASLSIDPAAQFLQRQRDFSDERASIQSPIVSRSKAGKKCVYENVEFQNDFGDESLRENIEAKSLIDQAWRSIHRAYERCRAPSEEEDEITSGEQEMHDEDEVEGEEDIAESISVGRSTESDPSEVQKPRELIIDPSVRPVRSPKPGRVPYKFDPVTRYHLYKTEWDRHPAPGEMRRLSLRWKVREFMLRHDVPRLNSNPDGIANHEKEWSPKPYMD